MGLQRKTPNGHGVTTLQSKWTWEYNATLE
jgi:hypothetical protein